MVTQAQTLTAARQMLGEPNTEVTWSNSELRGYINDAVADIARRTETIQKTATLPIAADVRKIAGPADALRIHTVSWKATANPEIYPLDIVDLHNMDAMWYTSQTTRKGVPTAVTFWGYPPAIDMVFYPTPNVAGEAQLSYYGLPARLADDGTAASSTLVVPAGYENLIVEYVCYLAQRRDANQRWQEHKQAYEEQIAQMHDNTRRWTDQHGYIVPNSGGGVLPDWLTG